jgi:small subunit ribosomal protein S6
MKHYELSFLISPILSTEEVQACANQMETAIQTAGGLIQKRSEVLKKNLGYPIKKHIEAFLATFNFEADPSKIEEVEKAVKANADILRYIILFKKPLKRIKVQRLPRVPRPAEEANGQETEKKPKEHKKVELKELDKEIEKILEE